MTNICVDINVRLVLILGLGFMGTKIIIYGINKILNKILPEE